MSVFSRLGFNRHVSDADLTSVWADARLGDPPRSAASGHVRDCAACRARLTSLSTWLDGLRIDARQEADEIFTREHLASQHAQILRRLEAMERPARVLAFPRFAQPVSTGHPGRHHWIAGAAAAGLLVGVGLGQVFQFRLPSGDFAPAPTQAVRSVNGPDRAAIQPVSFTDEEFFFDPGSAAARVPESLRSLHEITPSAREYDPR